MKNLLAPILFSLGASAAYAAEPAAAPAPHVASATELHGMAKRYAPVDLTADISSLSAGDRAAIVKL
ncbi:hypothetical protein, partial [Pseudoxanthomonas sp. KAs_5_3]|uniref:hypothetical protein n=1 Tax=Pseudoxanthomonas sp. KAs_5_3 TaxID=2067658 RepID=UPI0018EC3FB0